uniref:CSON004829 protein n=1 Tax=Culicoides sonorensis TaxID=179676 RepID=A0A336L844_CULSO
MNRLKGLIVTFLWYLVLSSVNFQLSECAKKSSASPPPSQPSNHVEPVIEEVNAKQLERILQDKDYVAVFWCK